MHNISNRKKKKKNNKRVARLTEKTLIESKTIEEKIIIIN